jgi:hypothetical protein
MLKFEWRTALYRSLGTLFSGGVPKQADGSELYFVFRVTAYIVFKFVAWIALG